MSSALRLVGAYLAATVIGSSISVAHQWVSPMPTDCVSAAERIAAIPGVVLLAPPQLSLFAFHVT